MPHTVADVVKSPISMPLRYSAYGSQLLRSLSQGDTKAWITKQMTYLAF
jgi:hypothetical protein